MNSKDHCGIHFLENSGQILDRTIPSVKDFQSDEILNELNKCQLIIGQQDLCKN